jgi:hypothetical protein
VEPSGGSALRVERMLDSRLRPSTITGAFPLARVAMGPTTVSAIALSPVSPLPVSLPPQLRVSIAEVEHMPIYLRTFFRVLSSWVHAIYLRKRLPGSTEEGVCAVTLRQRYPNS